MGDTFSKNGDIWPIQSWDGCRLNTKAHGPGTLVDEFGFTHQCTLNQGVTSGYCWVTGPDGYHVAQIFSTEGMLYGTQVQFDSNGDISLAFCFDGELAHNVQGMRMNRVVSFNEVSKAQRTFFTQETPCLNDLFAHFSCNFDFFKIVRL